MRFKKAWLKAFHWIFRRISCSILADISFVEKPTCILSDKVISLCCDRFSLAPDDLGTWYALLMYRVKLRKRVEPWSCWGLSLNYLEPLPIGRFPNLLAMMPLYCIQLSSLQSNIFSSALGISCFDWSNWSKIENLSLVSLKQCVPLVLSNFFVIPLCLSCLSCYSLFHWNAVHIMSSIGDIR